MNKTDYWVIVPAAGVGRRMNAVIPKQYLPLAGRTVIEHTLAILLGHSRIGGVVVAIESADRWWRTLRFSTDKPLLQVTGGEQRCQSVMNGLLALKEWAHPDDWVLVHDAVRPCLRVMDMDLLIEVLTEDSVGGLLAVPVRDTLKRADSAGRISATVDRNRLWQALTPQMFRLGILLTALGRALEKGVYVTDEAAAVEAVGLAPRLVEGHADNIKITCPEDLALAEFYLTRLCD
jgi:2-C-methyl-D-erythritol 4-phosphate cytidylyltransferase